MAPGDIDHEVLSTVSNGIINEVPGINRTRLAYGISSKPPSAIEWQ